MLQYLKKTAEISYLSNFIFIAVNVSSFKKYSLFIAVI